MKHILIIVAVIVSMTLKAQDITLPSPSLSMPSKSTIQTLADRHSVREYSSQPLSLQQISNLCWAACGKSRDDSHITAPSAMNRQEIRLFVCTDKGIYEYLANKNILKEFAKGDYRYLLASNNSKQGGGQEFVKTAPVSLIMVIDFDKFGQNNEKAKMMGCVDAGNVSENINLYCESVGLATVPRATMDITAIREVLKLTDNQLPIMNNPVGYPKGTDVFVTTNGTEVRFNHIKHGTLSIQINDKFIYIDPVIKAVPPVTDFSKMPKADYILITHEHFDHLDAEAISQLTKTETQLILNPCSSELLNGKGKILRNGQSTTIQEGQIDAVPAYNTTPEKMQYHPKGRDNGYVLTIDGLKIYIAGDTEDIPEMTSLKDIDIAFLPCNLPYTMTPEQLAKAAKSFSPKVLFPYHYGDTKIEQAVKLLDGTGIDVRIRNLR